MGQAIRTLLSAIVDYAGLFPPAKLDMAIAIAQYRHHQTEPQSWMLGRFVLRLSQLEQFQQSIPVDQPQIVSLILDGELEGALKQLNLLIRSSPSSAIQIAALEIPPCPLTQLQQILPQLPGETEVYCEIPWESELNSYLEVLLSFGASVKIRSGGLTPEAFPPSVQLSRILFSLAQSRIPFKATAGLHHPLPVTCPLSATPGSPLVTMQGFLNVAIAATFAYTQKATLAEIQTILETSTVNDWQLSDQEICWGLNQPLSLADIQIARRQFFRSFGSCSFQEPIEDLRLLGLAG
jgi:hypothetical protein